MFGKRYLRYGKYNPQGDEKEKVEQASNQNIESVPPDNKNIFLNIYKNTISYNKDQYRYEISELKNSIINRFNKLNDINDGIFSIKQKYAIHDIEQGFKPITNTDLTTISNSIAFLDETRNNISSSISVDNRIEILNNVEKQNIKQLLKLYNERYDNEMAVLNNFIKLQKSNLIIHNLQIQELDATKVDLINKEQETVKTLQLDNDQKLEEIKLIQTNINTLFSGFGIENIEYQESNLEKENQLLNLRNEKFNLETKLIEIQNKPITSYEEREKQILEISTITKEIYELENRLQIESKTIRKIVNNEVEKNIIPKYIENTIDKLSQNNLSNKALLELENDLYNKKTLSDNIISQINLNRKQINDKENEIVKLKKNLFQQNLFQKNDITYLSNLVNEKINKYRDAISDIDNQIIYILQEKTKAEDAKLEEKLTGINNSYNVLNQSHEKLQKNLQLLNTTSNIIDTNYKEIYEIFENIAQYDNDKYTTNKNIFITEQKKIDINLESIKSDVIKLFSNSKVKLQKELKSLQDNYSLKVQDLYKIFNTSKENIYSFTNQENTIIQLKKASNIFNEYPIYINNKTKKYKKYILDKLDSFKGIMTEDNEYKYSYPIMLETLKLTNEINIKEYQVKISEISSIVLKILKNKFIQMYDDYIWKKYDFINIHYYKIKDIIALLYSLFEQYNSIQKYYTQNQLKNTYETSVSALTMFINEKNNNYNTIISSFEQFGKNNKELTLKSSLLQKQINEVDNMLLDYKDKLFNFSQQLNILKNNVNDIQQNIETASNYDILRRLYIKTPILIVDYFLAIYEFDFYNSLTDLQQFLLKLNIECKINVVNNNYELIIENEFITKYKDIINDKKNTLYKEYKETNLFTTYLEFQLYFMINKILQQNTKLIFSKKFVYYYNYMILKKSKNASQKLNLIFPTYETMFDNITIYNNPSFNFSNEMHIIENILNENSFFVFFLLNIYRQISSLSLYLQYLNISLLQTSNIKSDNLENEFEYENRYSVIKAFAFNLLSYFIYNKKDISSVLIPKDSIKLTKLTNTFNTSFQALTNIKEQKYSNLKEIPFKLNVNLNRNLINEISEQEFINQNYLSKKKFSSTFEELKFSNISAENIENTIYNTYINVNDIINDQFITYNLTEIIDNGLISNQAKIGYYLSSNDKNYQTYVEGIITLLSPGVEMLKNNQVDLYNVEYTSEILYDKLSNL